MADIEQANVRVPPKAKPTLVRIAKRLRDEPSFLHRLNRYLDEEENTATRAFLADRVERLELQMASLLAERGDERGAPVAPQVETEGGAAPSDSSGAVWTTGEGRARRMTAEGDAEAQRLIREGVPDVQIATRLGVQPFTIATKRKRMAQEHNG